MLLKELREETVKRFQDNPDQFVIKQNTKEEAGAPFHVRMLMDEFANINEIPGFQEAVRKIKRFMEDEENLSKSSQKILKALQEKREINKNLEA